MKKVAVVLSVVLLMSIVLTGCSGLSGTYKLTGAEMNGAKVDNVSSLPGVPDLSFQFKSGGKVVVTTSGVSADAKYKVDGNNVEISVDGEVGMTLVKEGKTLVLDQFGVKLIFTK